MRGREKELEAVLGMIRAAETGRGGVLLVEGEPGIGKSRFLEEAAAAASARGFTVAWGQADARTAPGLCSFVPVREESPARAGQATRRAATSRPGWQPAAGRPAGIAPPGVAPPGVTAAGMAAAGIAPGTRDGQMLTVLDDLQCADRSSLWELRTLTRQVQGRPALWLLARSTATAYGDAEWLFSHLMQAGATRIRLGPLGETGMAEVLAGALEAAPDEGLRALAAGAGGNPLLLTELLAGLTDEGGIGTDAGSAWLVSDHLPQRFLAVIERWVAAFGPRTRQVLTVGAVLGRSFSLDDVATLLGETPARLLPDVDAALQAGLLVATRETLAFDRELVWRALAESVPRPVRQALHRQIGLLLLDRGGPVTEAASHLVSAGRPSSPAALARLDGAARSFLMTAPHVAADVGLKALLLSEPADQEWFPRTVTTVEALAAAGRLAEAGECTQSALAGPVPAPRPAEMRLRSLLSSIRFGSGRPAEAISLAGELLREPDLSREAQHGAEITFMLGLSISAEDFGEARLRAEAILNRAGNGHQDEPRRAAALLVQSLAAWWDGRLDAALGIARESARVASTASTLTSRGMAPLLLGGMLVSLGLLDEAEEVIQALSAAAAATRPAGRDPDTEILAAALALGAGRPEEAVTGAERGLNLAAAQGTELLSPFGLAILATSALRAGDLATAMRHVQGFQDRLARHGPGYGRTRCLVSAAQLAEARRDTDGAAELAARLHASLRNRPSVLLGDLTAPGWLVRFELARGNREHAEAACAAAGELAARNAGFSRVTAAFAHARGLLDHDSGALRHAAEECPDPWARASAAEDLGVLLISRQDFEEAGRRLEDSLAGYDQTASLRDSRRVRRRLRGIGIRHRHLTHAKRPKSGWTSLTDTERAVSDLVAKGLTNQQIAAEMFLSTHTVAFHLRQVFRKLDIGSRVHLARVFTEQAQSDSHSARAPQNAPRGERAGPVSRR
jgi:DNA-binding CsgD family transcriptional regulator